MDHLNSAWLTVGKKHAVPASGAVNPQPTACSSAPASSAAAAASSSNAPSAVASPVTGSTASGRGSTYSLKFSHSSPNAVALVNPATMARKARMQIGIRISFGDSCGPAWAPWRLVVVAGVVVEHGDGAGVVVGLQLALLLDVVAQVVRRQLVAEVLALVLGADRRRAAGHAEERQVRRPHGVGGGEERPDRGRST